MEFSASFRGEQQDKHLESRLLKELPGILNWAVAGCLKWQRDGLVSPQKVLDQTSEYLHEQDNVQNWIDERCDEKNTSGKDYESYNKLFESYCDWAQSCKEWELRKRQLGEKLAEKNFKKERYSQGYIFSGISLKKGIVSSNGDIQYE